MKLNSAGVRGETTTTERIDDCSYLPNQILLVYARAFRKERALHNVFTNGIQHVATQSPNLISPTISYLYPMTMSVLVSDACM